MPAGFRRHLVGKTLINVFSLWYRWNTLCWQASDHTAIFINQRIECYLDNTIKLRNFRHVIPTKWRSYRGRIFCDVTSPRVYNAGVRLASLYMDTALRRSNYAVTFAKVSTFRLRRQLAVCVSALPSIHSTEVPATIKSTCEIYTTLFHHRIW